MASGERDRLVRPLDDFLPVYEARERHSLSISATPERVDRAVRDVSLAEIPIARALFALRSVGRGSANAQGPLVESMLRQGVLLEDVPGEGLVLGLTGQFWRLRGAPIANRPRTAEEFAAYDRTDVAKAVMDLRVRAEGETRSRITTETRVHVRDAAARRRFRRYWLLVRPFSGLTRILLLRAARRRAEAAAA
jgi:hypothetical protein